MTPEGAKVLMGRHALDYSGGVSAQDNFGIGSYDRIMVPTVRPSTGPSTNPQRATFCSGNILSERAEP